jgi:hypothetical protein
MTKKFFFIVFLLLFGLSFIRPVFAQTNSNQAKLQIYFFYSDTCPHCKAEKAFLDTIQGKYPQAEITRYLESDTSHRKLLADLLTKHDAQQYTGLVPLTFVGEDFFAGFDNPDGIGKKIEDSIIRQLGNLQPQPEENKNKVHLPIIGDVDLSKYSLPLQAIILGFFDGFNVCSLGALVLILGLVLILRSRSKIILFGGLYILVTAVVYGALIFLWYQLFYYLAPVIKIMNVFVGLLGIGGAIYFLKQFIDSRKASLTCESQENKIVAKHSLKIQKAFQESGGIWGLIIGVLVFSAVITIVEFPCSAVIPVLFAGIMAHAKLSLLSYILYLALYLFLYMLDEIIVFLIAVFTMNVKIASGKTMTWLSLIEAIVLFGLGVYYLAAIF